MMTTRILKRVTQIWGNRIVLILMMVPACLFASEGSSTTNVEQNASGSLIIGGLSVIDYVHIINQQTQFRANCEMILPEDTDDPINPPGSIVVELAKLNKNTSFEDAFKEIITNQEYMLVRNGNRVNVIPRHYADSSKYVLNQPVKRFSVKNADLIDAFVALRQNAPSLCMIFPFLLLGGNGDLIPDKETRSHSAGRKITFEIRDTTVREILDAIVTRQPSMYWTAVSWRSKVEHPELKGETGISFYSAHNFRGSAVIFAHDPVLQQRFLKMYFPTDTSGGVSH